MNPQESEGNAIRTRIRVREGGRVVTPAEVHERREELLILDVRENDEWNAGRIDGALHIPMAEVDTRAEEIDPTCTIACVCRSGTRSAKITNMLRSRGYDIHNMDGGMRAWDAAGLPFVDKSGGPGRVV